MERTPKKPLTPFFLFREYEKRKGNNLGAKEAGEKWRDLTEREREPFVKEYQEAREKYDNYLESEGITPKKSSKKSTNPLVYKSTRIRSMLGMIDEIKSLSLRQCSALGKVAV